MRAEPAENRHFRAVKRLIANQSLAPGAQACSRADLTRGGGLRAGRVACVRDPRGGQNRATSRVAAPLSVKRERITDPRPAGGAGPSRAAGGGMGA
jgi:hypothetical protein